MYKKIIYALGFFDGVHLGHQALLTACRELAKEHGCFSGVWTFTNHPRELVAEQTPVLLNTIEDRKQLLRHYRIDTIVYSSFDKTLMSKSWQAFLEDLLINDAAGFVCGEDFRFGHKGLGTAEKLADFCRERGLPCVIVPDQTLDGIRISSTHIRGLLAEGDMAEANRFLGHPHIFSGEVVQGKQLGRTIGFPTANLTFPEGLIVPRFGVYACGVSVDEDIYYGVANIGTRPTVDGEGITAEVHLLDFEGDLYGKEISVAFYKFLRPEQKFASLEELQREIQKNAHETRIFFEKSQ